MSVGDQDGINSLLEKLGNPGKFQVISYAILVTNVFCVISNHLSAVFYTAKTEFYCRANYNESNVTQFNHEKDECSIKYLKNNVSVTVPCSNGWIYRLKHGENTIISEFNLVCGDAYKSELSTTLYFGGVLVGALLYGGLADKYGRKRCLAIAQVLSGVLSFAVVFIRYFYAYAVLRFFLGIQLQALVMVSFVLGMEMCTTKYRGLVGVAFGIFSMAGGGILGVIAFFIRDWKYIQLTLSFFPFIQLCLLWFVPESIRWLILHEKFDKVERAIQRIKSFNNLPQSADVLQEIKMLKDRRMNDLARKGNIVDLFKSTELRKRSFLLLLGWFTVSAAYYGLSFNISFLFGDKYLNFGVGIVMDTLVISASFWALPRFGCRRPIVLLFAVCGIANFVSVATTAVQSDKLVVKLLGTVTSLVGKSSAIASLNALSIFTAELYPTAIRNAAVGFCSACTRMGGMLASQIFLIGSYTAVYVPFGILGVLSVISCVLVLYLPETHNKALTDTLHRRSSVLVEEDFCDVDAKDCTEEKHLVQETSL
ncbi:solute carrier family 22 member 6-A-like isoform X1 [Xenia sp. Carnegie-2017]|uniref:solute carrier family 22 member 6-A-like isoform X1 n=1 Tax=Xenia sp. Carnegie-2017 TaxID=2897299 RepID=UPI001F048877|nr:solute carrier family 22 member 6-A-like isoform X1 [Xenia sp. Carnegie-2017]